MDSGFLISQSDKRPMYLQIMEQVKQKIAVGDWKGGQALPSIRQLAVELRVSVITVKRAYLELEREGIIVTHHGRGSIVASGVDLGAALLSAELDQHLAQAVHLSALMGLPMGELEARLRAAGDRISKKEAL